MAGLTWLHLSDWHQRGKDFDRHVVGDKLLEDILNRGKNIHPDLEKVDLVIFSGDVAFSGKREEYQAAIETLFKPVLEAIGLGTDRLFIIPGNHDFDRDEIELLPEGIKRPFESDEQVNEWLTNDRRRSYLLSPFAAYQDFVSKFTGQNYPTYASFQRVEGLDKSLALLGLNSALMCNRHKNERNETDDRGFLVVGEPQIHDRLQEIADAEVRIAVVHHPFDWLIEFDDDHVEDRLKRECHFILCGHLHKPKVILEQGTAGECVIIPAGALYDRRIPHNPRYTNAFNFVHLDFDTVRGTVYLRHWSERNTKWTADTESAPNGFLQFRLPKEPELTSQTNTLVQQSGQMRSVDIQNIDSVRLRKAMANAFNLTDLEILCANLQVPFENIDGNILETKILHLIQYCQRRSLYVKLVHRVLQERPLLLNE